MSKAKDARLTITLDLTGFMRAVQQAAQAFNRVSNTIAESFTETGRLRRNRRLYGGMGTDAKEWPEHWQSTACVVWLHSDCPSSEHALGCTCHCHLKESA